MSERDQWPKCEQCGVPVYPDAFYQKAHADFFALNPHRPHGPVDAPDSNAPTDAEIDAGACWWWDHGMWSPNAPERYDQTSEEMRRRARAFAEAILIASRTPISPLYVVLAKGRS